jgi:dihydroneopterin aldolase
MLKREESSMDTIFINNLETYGILGIHPHEQRKPQPIRVSVRIDADISRASEMDDIHKTINYSTLAKMIIDFIDESHYFTIEALIEALADEILSDDRIPHVWLRIEKPNAVPNAESVGVEVTRSKNY